MLKASAIHNYEKPPWAAKNSSLGQMCLPTGVIWVTLNSVHVYLVTATLPKIEEKIGILVKYFAYWTWPWRIPLCDFAIPVMRVQYWAWSLQTHFIVESKGLSPLLPIATALSSTRLKQNTLWLPSWLGYEMHIGNIKVWVQIHLSHQPSSASMFCVGEVRLTALALKNCALKCYEYGTK